MLSEVIEEFTIFNGRIIDEDYPFQFHFFETKTGGVVKFVLPGIIHESVIIKTEGVTITLTCKVDKSSITIYQSKSLLLNGELPIPVLSGVLTSEYSRGILSVEFIADQDNK